MCSSWVRARAFRFYSSPGRQLPRCGFSDPWNAIHLRGADEVVLGQALDGMGREDDAAVVVADLEVRMVVLDVGHMRDGVHETHRPIEILERQLAADRLAIRRQDPCGIEFGEQLNGCRACEGLHSTLTGSALFLSEV